MSKSISGAAPTLPSGVAVQQVDLAQLRAEGERLHFGSSARVGTLLAGAHRSQFRGRGIEFAEVREYHPGDDPRSIDWRVTARTGKVHTKLFHEERERPVLFLVDQGATMRFGTRRAFKSVLAARLTALLGFASLSGGDRVGGVLVHDQGLQPFKALRSRRRWLFMLEHLARATQQPPLNTPGACAGPTLDRALKRLRPLTSPGCQVILLSDFYRPGAEFQTAFRILAKRVDLHLVHLVDPLEQKAPPVGRYRVSDGIKVAEIDSRNKRLQREWNQSLLQRQGYLEALCGAHDASYSMASTVNSAAEILTSSYLVGAR